MKRKLIFQKSYWWGESSRDNACCLLRAAEKYDIVSLFGTIFKKEPYFNNEQKDLDACSVAKKCSGENVSKSTFSKNSGKKG